MLTSPGQLIYIRICIRKQNFNTKMCSCNLAQENRQLLNFLITMTTSHKILASVICLVVTNIYKEDQPMRQKKK